MTSRESAGVTLPLEFRIDFLSVFTIKCNITVISLLLGKYTRTFVPRFPGIPEMLYFPPPSASGNITSRGFPGTSGQTFWYISLKSMKYLYNISSGIDVQQFSSVHKMSMKFRGISWFLINPCILGNPCTTQNSGLKRSGCFIKFHEKM